MPIVLSEFDIDAGQHGRGKVRVMVSTELPKSEWIDLIRSLLYQMPQAISQVDNTTIKELRFDKNG